MLISKSIAHNEKAKKAKAESYLGDFLKITQGQEAHALEDSKRRISDAIEALPDQSIIQTWTPKQQRQFLIPQMTVEHLKQMIKKGFNFGALALVHNKNSTPKNHTNDPENTLFNEIIPNPNFSKEFKEYLMTEVFSEHLQAVRKVYFIGNKTYIFRFQSSQIQYRFYKYYPEDYFINAIKQITEALDPLFDMKSYPQSLTFIVDRFEGNLMAYYLPGTDRIRINDNYFAKKSRSREEEIFCHEIIHFIADHQGLSPRENKYIPQALSMYLFPRASFSTDDEISEIKNPALKNLYANAQKIVNNALTGSKDPIETEVQNLLKEHEELLAHNDFKDIPEKYELGYLIWVIAEVLRHQTKLTDKQVIQFFKSLMQGKTIQDSIRAANESEP